MGALYNLPAALVLGNAAMLLCLPSLGRRRPSYGNRFGLPAPSPFGHGPKKQNDRSGFPGRPLFACPSPVRTQAIGEWPPDLGGSISILCSGIRTNIFICSFYLLSLLLQEYAINLCRCQPIRKSFFTRWTKPSLFEGQALVLLPSSCPPAGQSHRMPAECP